MTKESASGQSEFSVRMSRLDAEFKAKRRDVWSALAPRQFMGLDVDDNSPFSIGGKRSFVPALGKTVWELPSAVAARVPISARIYQLADGRPIGYVRVPHYTPDDTALEMFADVVSRFEGATEALVFDQVNNYGGGMLHMYSVVSHLISAPLVPPKHQFTLNHDDADADMASDVVALAEAGESVPVDDRPSPDIVAYSRFVLSEIEAGRKKPTKLGYLAGVKEILPAKNHYTKKIVVLINEVVFSAAEFLAAMLQDSKRATLFGQRTAGAGGCAKWVSVPNAEHFGIESLTVRWTLAWRVTGRPIEGLGVHPDVHYSITAEDLKFGYSAYRQALLATIGA